MGQETQRLEIIETYWNVNKYSFNSLISESIGNNRNILECKWYTARYTGAV